MKSENFCYWLKGFDEITGGQVPTKAQWEVIRNHLALVFTQVIDSTSILSAESTSEPTSKNEGEFDLKDTTLELAKAYLEMGDFSGAKHLCLEVLESKEGCTADQHVRGKNILHEIEKAIIEDSQPIVTPYSPYDGPQDILLC